jgi:hypothetical protein
MKLMRQLLSRHIGLLVEPTLTLCNVHVNRSLAQPQRRRTREQKSSQNYTGAHTLMLAYLLEINTQTLNSHIIQIIVKKVALRTKSSTAGTHTHIHTHTHTHTRANAKK